MISDKIRLAPYRSTLYIIVSPEPYKDIAQLNQRFPGLELVTGDSSFDAVTFSGIGPNGNHLVIVAFDITQDINIEDMAHEAVHVVNAVFEHAGAKIDIDNDEPYAYLLGYVAELFSTEIQKYKNKNGRRRAKTV